jgi:hypothetical protein
MSQSIKLEGSTTHISDNGHHDHHISPAWIDIHQRIQNIHDSPWTLFAYSKSGRTWDLRYPPGQVPSFRFINGSEPSLGSAQQGSRTPEASRSRELQTPQARYHRRVPRPTRIARYVSFQDRTRLTIGSTTPIIEHIYHLELFRLVSIIYRVGPLHSRLRLR